MSLHCNVLTLNLLHYRCAEAEYRILDIVREKEELAIRCQAISGERDAAIAESDSRQNTIKEVMNLFMPDNSLM